MPMKHHGLPKLIAECGELTQVAGKMLDYPNLVNTRNEHPDGTVLRDRMQEEIADVLAAIEFVNHRIHLDERAIAIRVREKLALFNKWASEPEPS